MTIAQPWRKPAALLGAAIIAGSGIIGAAPRHTAHAAPRTVPAIPNGGTVIVAEAQTPETLSILQNQSLSVFDIDGAVFDSLIYLDQTGRFQNNLAARYTHDAKGLRWTFFLNPKAAWQDGAPLTAKDVVFTAGLINNSKFGATATLGWDHIKSIKATGKYQVDVTLTSVYALFLQYVGTTAIYPEHVLGKVAPDKIRSLTSFIQKPLGSGPFKITEYAAGDHITEVANKNYFRGAPHLDKIIFRIVPNNNTAINQIQTGEINVLGQTSSLSARQFNLLKRFPNVTTYNTPGFVWDHLDLIQSGFFKDRTVRQALAYATPKQQLIDQVALGYGVISDADQAPGTLSYNPAIKDSYPYNLAKARTLLIGDGFKPGANGVFQKGGRPLSINLWGDAGNSDSKLTLQVLKQAWSKVGIDTSLKPVATSLLFSATTGPLGDPNRLSFPSTNAVLYDWIASAEPDDSYYWDSNQIPNKKIAGGRQRRRIRQSRDRQADGAGRPDVRPAAARGHLQANPDDPRPRPARSLPVLEARADRGHVAAAQLYPAAVQQRGSTLERQGLVPDAIEDGDYLLGILYIRQPLR